MLTKRFCIFTRPLQCKLSKWSLICTVAAKLHNICVDKNIPEVERYGPDVAHGDLWDVFLNERRPDVEHCERSVGLAGARRRAIAEALHMQGIHRPQRAMHNSRK